LNSMCCRLIDRAQAAASCFGVDVRAGTSGSASRVLVAPTGNVWRHGKHVGIAPAPLAKLQGTLSSAAMEDWNEPQLVLAVHRASSLTGAAKALDIDQSTAFRRLNALEARLGVRLFERLPGGAYQATPAGERMAAAAERMEDEALAIDRDIAGRDHRLSGRLRVTSSETLAYRKLTSHLATFRRTHPGIIVELVVDNRILNLSRREADVALRPMRPKEADLWG